ncbi:hypothetical protein BVRB_1g017360 [Beta vulgaris subsp. vulgaris]|nr:hypothetical protein BVRB_1g017360 [Beta vulgaris subsp. vulgaris]
MHKKIFQYACMTDWTKADKNSTKTHPKTRLVGPS